MRNCPRPPACRRRRRRGSKFQTQTEMEVEAEVFEPLELRFADVLLLSSSSSSVRDPFSPTKLKRLESLSAAVMRALGPSGPGLLSITHVPRAPALRRALLPFARQLALLDNKDRARVLKEHGLGSDVSLKNPDRTVSSFSSQLKYIRGSRLESPLNQVDDTNDGFGKEDIDGHRSWWSNDNEFEHLGVTFKELGFCMMELGLRIAQICDKGIGGSELEETILESCMAKGRLIHYHSAMDRLILKENQRKTKGRKQKARLDTLSPLFHHGFSVPERKMLSESVKEGHHGQAPSEEVQLTGSRLTEERCCKISLSNLWQQWHYDYGILTVLTTPMFMSPYQANSDTKDLECSSPGHSYLQLFDPTKNKILIVKSRPESFIIQVGESADILSRGKLRSTLHSIGRPREPEHLSRETFVVFLQPAWNRTLSYSECLLEAREEKILSSKGKSESSLEDVAPDSTVIGCEEPHQLMQEILRKIPPLSFRLRDKMTFAEFSRETTKQYYGDSGTQSQR